MKKITIVLLALSLMSCASSPDKMQTAYVSPLAYKNHDCDQLAEEVGRVSRRENDLYKSLKSESDADNAQMAVGLVLFWPALFLLEGGDRPLAGEYSRLKGERVAIEEVAVKKKCSAEIILDAQAMQFSGSKATFSIKGWDDGVKTDLATDRNEALENAKLQALEKAGYNTSYITGVDNVETKQRLLEKKSSQILVSGYKINDKGYQKNGSYLVTFVGKVNKLR